MLSDVLRLAGRFVSVDDGQLAGQLLGRIRVGDHPWLAGKQDQSRFAGGRLSDRQMELGSRSVAGVVAPTIAGDGSILVLEPDATVRIFDLRTGTERTPMGGWPGHPGVLLTGPIAVDRTAGRAASATVQLNDQRVHDNPIRVWDLARGEEIQVLRGHTDWVRALAFAGPDRIVSAAQDGSVRVWDVESGMIVAWFGTDDRLLSVAADPTGTSIVAGASDGAMHFFRLKVTAERAAAGVEVEDE